jgi:hypothetical protein
MRNTLAIRRASYLTATLLMASGSLAQQKSLTRSFTTGTTETYLVLVSIRAETRGISTETVGDKTFIKPFTHEASGRMEWQTVREIGVVNEDGSAAIQERVEKVLMLCTDSRESGGADFELQKSLQLMCGGFERVSTLAYEEEKYGAIHGIPEEAKWLAGQDTPLVSLWLRRALRPSLILPKEPMRFGVREEHKVGDAAHAPGTPNGTEASEWTEAGGESPAVTYHLAQDLAWLAPAKAAHSAKLPSLPGARESFYADSLNTVSLLDGSVLIASRSATYETKQVLEPVPGIPDAPEFGSKLTITVTMHRLP